MSGADAFLKAEEDAAAALEEVRRRTSDVFEATAGSQTAFDAMHEALAALGEDGPRLAQLADATLENIGPAIGRLRGQFDEPFQEETREAVMVALREGREELELLGAQLPSEVRELGHGFLNANSDWLDASDKMRVSFRDWNAKYGPPQRIVALVQLEPGGKVDVLAEVEPAPIAVAG